MEIILPAFLSHYFVFLPSIIKGYEEHSEGS